jgi:transcription elongation factor/antiterminator RfaH
VKRWFAAQTQRGKEHLALQHLGNQDFEAFCPLRRTAKRLGNRHVTALSPFFPSYVFVHLDPAAERWRSINGTIGVIRLVSFGPDPAPMPDGLVERLQELSSPEGELSFDEDLRAGDHVRIVGGAFDALCGQLVTEAPRKRVTILLELLSGATRVDVERARLVPI